MFALSRHSLRASRCTSSSPSSDDTNTDPNCEIVMTRSSSPNTIERDVSSRGSSNDVGSARIYFLTERKVRISSSRRKNDPRIKNPKGHADRGCFRELKRYTRCFPRAGCAICLWVIRSLWEGSCSPYSAKKKVSSLLDYTNCFSAQPPWRAMSRRTRFRRSLYMLRRRRAPMQIFRGVCKGRKAARGWIYSHFVFSILEVYIYWLGTHEIRTWFSRSEST